MSRHSLLLTSLFLCFCTVFAQQTKKTQKKGEAPHVHKAQQNENLIANGNLEKGKGREPNGWACIDGLTAIWDTDGNPGRCLLFDTAVFQKDKKTWKVDESAYKGPSKGGQYDTVGAHEGVWAYALPIDLTPEDSYFVIECDVMGSAKSSELFYPMVLIRGFNLVTEEKAGKDSSWFHTYHKDGPAYSEMFGPDELYRPSKAGDYLMVYRHTLACRLSVTNKWEHFAMGFKLPAKDMKRFRPQRLLIKPYAFWPNGKYRFDNIILRRSTKEEMNEINAKRKSIKEFQ